MSDSSPNQLPPELNMVLNTKGYSLLLQGEVGVGKTELGLELLANAQNPFYLSMGGHHSHIHQRYPWLSESLGPDCILDLRKTVRSARQQPSRTTLSTSLSQIISTKKDIMPTVFINGWNTLLQSLALEPTTWPQWHQALIEIVRRRNWTLIITTTLPNDLLEELVDGVVHLYRRPVSPVRPVTTLQSTDTTQFEVLCLDIRKLTGIPIKRRHYVFSIAGQRFRYLPPSPFAQTSPPPKPILSSKEQISTGVREFDNLLNGGYPRGAATLLEVTASVARRRHPLIHAAAVNTLRTGCGLLYLIEEDIPLDALINQHLLPFVGQPKLKHLHVSCLPQENIPECKDIKDEEQWTEHSGFCQIPLYPDDFEKTSKILMENRQIINDRYDTHLEIIESGTLERVYTPSILPAFLRTAKDCAYRNNSALLFIADHSTSHRQGLRRLSDFHLLLDAIEGVPVLQGFTPSFDPHAVEISQIDGIKLSLIS
ncbi:MAG: hypothetical protein ACFFDP_01140 [Promethearchaeota archaeon]